MAVSANTTITELELDHRTLGYRLSKHIDVETGTMNDGWLKVLSRMTKTADRIRGLPAENVSEALIKLRFAMNALDCEMYDGIEEDYSPMDGEYTQNTLAKFQAVRDALTTFVVYVNSTFPPSSK